MKREESMFMLFQVPNEKEENNEVERYTPPKHSKAFLRHLQDIKSSWPSYENVENQAIASNNDYKVECTGEPSEDPSRTLQRISDDDYDWI